MKELVTFEAPNILVVRLAGEPSPEEMQEVLDKLGQLEKDVNNPDILADLSGLKNIPPDTRKIVAKEGPWPTYEKLAVIGASARLRILATLMLKLIPNIKKSKFFSSEEEARVWLSREK